MAKFGWRRILEELRIFANNCFVVKGSGSVSFEAVQMILRRAAFSPRLLPTGRELIPRPVGRRRGLSVRHFGIQNLPPDFCQYQDL